MVKRGAGNVEFILSFVLFISFTAIALYFFSPIRGTQNLESSRDYAMNTIIENTSIDIESYSVIINGPGNEQNIKVRFPGISPGKNARVVDYFGSGIDSKRDSEDVCFEVNKSQDFVTVYFSEDIESSAGSCKGSLNYKIASQINSKVISEDKIRELNKSYYSDYAALKEQFNIPAGIDFSFSVEFPNGDIISAERKIPARNEVYSDTQIKEILRIDGTSSFAHLTVKVW